MSALSPDRERLERDSFLDEGFHEPRSRASSTTSITSSTFNYPKENGRTYHNYKGGNPKYYFPNDEEEMDRLDLQHELFQRALDGNLFLAPISDSAQDILDIGTGTGIWAIEVADLYPNAIVIGLDISPIQPTWVPPNCKFWLENANETWDFEAKFDLVHCRQMHMALDEKHLFWQSHEALKPGGWLEISEIALPLRCQDKTLKGTALLRWHDEMMRASVAIGTPFDKPHSYRQWMEEAGFVNVQEVVKVLPLNTWPKDPRLKDLGLWQWSNLQSGLNGFSLALFTKGLGWSRSEVDDLLADVRQDIADRNIHAYWEWVVVIGQKPPSQQVGRGRT
jgi:SAM-dependent methyltransferase